MFYLVTRLFSDYGTWYLVGLGLLAIVVTLYFPRGSWSYASAESRLQLFPVRRHLRI